MRSSNEKRLRIKILLESILDQKNLEVKFIEHGKRGEIKFVEAKLGKLVVANGRAQTFQEAYKQAYSALKAWDQKHT
jgi:hypothetical protein